MNMNVFEANLRLTAMYNENRAYYDCKVEAKLLGIFFYCLLFNPKLMTQSHFVSTSLPIWLLFYRNEKVLTKFNYIFHRFGTNYTKRVHKIRLRPVKPLGGIDNLTVKFFQKNSEIPIVGKLSW